MRRSAAEHGLSVEDLSPAVVVHDRLSLAGIVSARRVQVDREPRPTPAEYWWRGTNVSCLAFFNVTESCAVRPRERLVRSTASALLKQGRQAAMVRTMRNRALPAIILA